MLIDSHCHLDPSYLPQGPEEVLANARQAGVGGFMCVGVGDNLGPMQRAVQLAQRRADVAAAVGVHPHDASACTEQLFEQVAALVQSAEVLAVGEIGLDYHYDFSPREQQREVFRKFIQLARRVRKPIVIHTREAQADTLQIMREEKAEEVGGVFHCFSEDLPFARQALDMGFDISFSGIVTFPKSTVLQEVARFVPADRFLVETDSPYLAPVPFRGKKCQPAYVVHTAKRIAELRAEPLEQLTERTTDTFVRRFSPSQAFRDQLQLSS